MTNTKHTPGPWVVNYEGDVRGADGRTVPWTKDDARLIAAAPELLAALEWAMGYLPTEGQSVTWMRGHAAARTAIARAKGESK